MMILVQETKEEMKRNLVKCDDLFEELYLEFFREH